MLSIDYRDIELLRSFATFFGALADPKQLAETLKGVKGVLDSMEDTCKKYETVQQAQELMVKAEKTVADSVNTVQAGKDEITDNKLKYLDWKKEQDEDMEKRLKALQDYSKKVEQDKKGANDLLDRGTKIMEQLSKRENDVYAREQAVIAREKELNAKAAQIKAIVG